MIRAVLDACVIYPPSLRDLLMRVAARGLYRPHFTEAIHTEWIRNVKANNPEITLDRLDRTRLFMNQISPDCLISNYERHISYLNLPDIDDRHVLPAAIEANAKFIVTFNLGDFPELELNKYNVTAQHPDIFLSVMFENHTARVLDAMRNHRVSLNNPPKTPKEYLATLRANSLTQLAQHAEAFAHSL
ncbi:MAG: PIN domain-containing protein [Chthonomonadales bacterium]